MTAPMSAFLRVDGLDRQTAMHAATDATRLARHLAPKLSGASSSNFFPIGGDGYFGIGWLDSYVWHQEVGIHPFTMRALAGKTIPMWISDPTGRERGKYPDAKTRVTESGVTQVLIFRRAAPIGARKRIQVRGETREVPASYPGAPGRIAVREAPAPHTSRGRVGGRIAAGNVGVRWRHPGLDPRSFIQRGIIVAAEHLGLIVRPTQIETAA